MNKWKQLFLVSGKEGMNISYGTVFLSKRGPWVPFGYTLDYVYFYRKAV